MNPRLHYKRVAFYGGSFNPPHASHQATVLYALEHANVDQVIVAPAYIHAEGKRLASYEDRLEMCRRMCEPFSRADVVVSNIEERAYNQGSAGLTCNVLRILRDSHLIDTVVLVLGSDIKSSYPNWTGASVLADMERAHQVETFWVSRVDGVSSTNVRERIRNGLHVDRLVPWRVREYITEKDLYTYKGK